MSVGAGGWQLEKAFDMAQEVDALFTNFDASVYTIIFIPADAAGVLPPGAEKYLKQVRSWCCFYVYRSMCDKTPVEFDVCMQFA